MDSCRQLSDGSGRCRGFPGRARVPPSTATATRFPSAGSLPLPSSFGPSLALSCPFPSRLFLCPPAGHRCSRPLPIFLSAPPTTPLLHPSLPAAATARLGVVDLPRKFHRPVWQICTARALAPHLHPRNIDPATDLVSLLSPSPMCPAHSSVRPSTPEPVATSRPLTGHLSRALSEARTPSQTRSPRALPLLNATTLVVRPGVGLE